MGKRNPSYGCPKVALLISNRFGIDINKDVIRRILALHYKPDPHHYSDPSAIADREYEGQSLAY